MAKKRRRHKRRDKRKHIALWLSALLIAAGGILTILRWDAWFGNKPEAAYTTPQTFDRITLTPGKVFDSERTLSWRFGQILQDAWVEVGIASGDTAMIDRSWIPARGQDVQSRSGHGCYYQVNLYGLRSGATYRYRLHTGRNSSARYTFTMPDGKLKSRFLYLGDIQDPIGEASLATAKKLDSLTKEVDFIAFAGDQIEGPSNEYWEIWYQTFGRWSPSLATLAATGNHEYLKRGFLRELDPRWIPQYGFPKNGPKGFEGRSYFVDFPLYRYIVLDSNGIMGPIDILRHRSWLSEALRGSAQPWQIVMMHHGIYNAREGRIHPVMRYAFRSVLEDDGADLVLQGHDHAYSRITSKTEQGDSITPVYIISSSSPKLYRNGFDEIHDRLGSGLQLYQVIEVTEQEISYKSYQYSGVLYDDLLLKHSGNMRTPAQVIDRARHIPELFLFNSFGTSSKGQKKALEYQQAAKEYLEQKAQLR